ncbi:MAG: hypothetical protein ACFFCV_22130 [Promethearchaeota archaeon]
MNKISDLHIHSRFSGGASKNIDIYRISSNCRIKGIDIVGTGDCLHPLWLNELKDSLIEALDGTFYNLNVPNVHFILQTEVEVIWKYNFKFKKAHFIILFPNFEKLEESIEFLSKFGNLSKEGRPKIYTSPEKVILGLSYNPQFFI